MVGWPREIISKVVFLWHATSKAEVRSDRRGTQRTDIKIKKLFSIVFTGFTVWFWFNITILLVDSVISLNIMKTKKNINIRRQTTNKSIMIVLREQQSSEKMYLKC